MGMTLYLCITPIAHCTNVTKTCTICVLKLVVADRCFISINVATRFSLVNIRLLPSSTSDFYAAVSYKLNASINEPNKAQVPSLNPKQSEISPLNGEVVYNLIYVKC